MALADEQDVVTAPVVVEAPRDSAAGRALEEPAFVTVVRVDPRREETTSTAEALAQTVGVSVRALGGLGAFASISMRGAAAGQTEILIDGVPLSRVAFSSIDLSSIDLAAFDQVDVYRGGVPVALGGAVLGGAVDFTTTAGPGRDGRKNQVTFGGGSFGARAARVARRDAFGDGRLRSTIGVSYAGATGDFNYFDDNGTPLDPGDDATRPRANDAYDQLDAAARLAWRAAPPAGARVDGGARLSWKDQGVPGPSGTRAEHTELSTFRAVADAKARATSLFASPALAGQLGGYVVVERQRWQDPDGEAGFGPADSTYGTLAAGVSAGLDVAAGERQRLSLGVETRFERFGDDDAVGMTSYGGTRLLGALSLADEIVLGPDDDLVLLPALRVDVQTTRGDKAPGTPILDPTPDSRDDAFLSPRLSARWRLATAVTLKGNVGRYFRPPTVVELFGSRGFVIGNGALRPESGTTSDLGVVLAPKRAAGPLDRLYLEAAVFAGLSDDLIAFVPTSARVVRAENLSGAGTLGAELALSARLGRTLSLTGNYTFLDARERSEMVSSDGKQLPGRPRHELYLRADLELHAGQVELGCFGDLQLVSGNFLDEGNLDELPARRLVGAGVRVAPTPGITLTITAKNLLDDTVDTVASAVGPVPRAVADVLGFPLPGRAFYATLDLRF